MRPGPAATRPTTARTRPGLAPLALALLLAAAGCTRGCAPGGHPAAPLGKATHEARPPFRCLPDSSATPADLVREAEDALDDSAPERALGCADEALRAAPRLVRALAARGEALGDLGRTDDAQLAFARALALEPDDALALAGAADLHVRQLGGSHDALEAGLAEAERGLRALTRVPRKEPGLALRLELAAAAAQNDLGRASEALPHAERAVKLRPEEPAAWSELGYARFELCRFDEAKAAFEKALALGPGDAWAIHHLGLIAERRGDEAEARRLLDQAHALSPEDLPAPVAIAPEAFRAEVERAVAALTAEDRAALKGVPVRAEELPALEDLAGEPPLSPTILGLYRGPPAGEACLPEDGEPCRSISLYRKNLARFARDRAELDEQIRVTITHELGHLRGEDDDELRDRGLE